MPLQDDVQTLSVDVRSLSDALPARLEALLAEKLDAFQAKLQGLISQATCAPTGREKEYYSTAEVAERAGRSEYQVREWCRTGRIEAVKRPGQGRGRYKEWMVSHEELQRYQSQGLREAARSPA